MGKANVTMIHAGDGSALRVEFHYQNDDRAGFVRFRFAERGGNGFDFDGGIPCDLGFDAVSRVLCVIRGEAENLNDGKPIDLGNGTMFAMEHFIDGKESGYALACLVRDDGRRMKFVMKPHEALGLESAISGSMFFLAFVKGVNQ